MSSLILIRVISMYNMILEWCVSVLTMTCRHDRFVSDIYFFFFTSFAFYKYVLGVNKVTTSPRLVFQHILLRNIMVCCQTAEQTYSFTTRHLKSNYKLLSNYIFVITDITALVIWYAIVILRLHNVSGSGHRWKYLSGWVIKSEVTAMVFL